MDINQLNEKLIISIKTAAKRICSKTKKPGKSKLITTTMQIMKAIRRDMKSHRTRVIRDIIEKNKNMKVLRSRLFSGKQIITNIRKQGVVVSGPQQIPQVILQGVVFVWDACCVS